VRLGGGGWRRDGRKTVRDRRGVVGRGGLVGEVGRQPHHQLLQSAVQGLGRSEGNPQPIHRGPIAHHVRQHHRPMRRSRTPLQMRQPSPHPQLLQPPRHRPLTDPRVGHQALPRRPRLQRLPPRMQGHQACHRQQIRPTISADLAHPVLAPQRRQPMPLIPRIRRGHRDRRRRPHLPRIRRPTMRRPTRPTHHRPQHRRPRPPHPHLTRHTQAARRPGRRRHALAGPLSGRVQLGRPRPTGGNRRFGGQRAGRPCRRHGSGRWYERRLGPRPRVVGPCGTAPGLPCYGDSSVFGALKLPRPEGAGRRRPGRSRSAVY
jgi:hypothetical protein